MKILNYLFLAGRKSYTCSEGAAKSGSIVFSYIIESAREKNR